MPMRLLAAIILGAGLGAGTVLALIHNQSTLEPAPVRAVFQNLTPYKPPPLPSRAPSTNRSGSQNPTPSNPLPGNPPAVPAQNNVGSGFQNPAPSNPAPVPSRVQYNYGSGG